MISDTTVNRHHKVHVENVLEEIEATSNNTRRGELFEKLTAALIKTRPEFEATNVWTWAAWPDRKECTGLDASDVGIDLVAKRRHGGYAAIQCKFRKVSGNVSKSEIDSFLGSSAGRECFNLRWLVVNRPLSKKMEQYISGLKPQVQVVNLHQYSTELVDGRIEHPRFTPWPEQQQAIEATLRGFESNDRGRLIMACGTGKTFTSLRIAEELVPEGGRILYLVPSIALIGQARRVWLAQASGQMEAIAVCSDSTVGKEVTKSGHMDLSARYLECEVHTNPSLIAGHLKKIGGGERFSSAPTSR